MIIGLTDYETTLCDMFAWESAKSQQQTEFGNKATKPRSIEEIARDNIIGKRGEAAVSKMLWRDLGLHLQVNYQVYPITECDDNDIVINNWTIDVKTTRNGRFVLFERSKVISKRKRGALPDMIVLCRISWDDQEDRPKDNSVDVVGCIGMTKLTGSTGSVLRLKAGDCIPGTRTPLQADNYAVRIDDLDSVNSFREYVKYMMDHERGGRWKDAG